MEKPTKQMKGRCKSCKYWDEDILSEDHREWGECHRRSPARFRAEFQRIPKKDDQSEAFCAVWPRVTAYQWCGEYALRK